MNSYHCSREGNRGFVAWCLVLAMSMIVMCVGIYTSACVQEYRETTQYLETKANVQRDMDSCRMVLLRMLMARTYLGSGVQITPTCFVVDVGTNNVKYSVNTKLYSAVNTVRYGIDSQNGQVTVQ